MTINAFLVEDKLDLRMVLTEAMEEILPLKFIAYAETETAARQWLDANDSNWNLMIVDLFLSEGSGIGILKECQSRKPNQKVVVLTSYPQESVLARCKELGADEVFDKSNDVEKLVHFCRTHAKHLEALM